jgi:hypothetical protein
MKRSPWSALAALALAGAAAPALAAPAKVALVPPSGARFLVGQRFDVRVEGQGQGPYRATLEIDGKPVAFTSGKQGTVETRRRRPAARSSRGRTTSPGSRGTPWRPTATR